jgi:hypothetical protein
LQHARALRCDRTTVLGHRRKALQRRAENLSTGNAKSIQVMNFPHFSLSFKTNENTNP